MADATLLSEWNHQRVRGYIETWVARPKQRLETAAATIQTICRKHSIPAAQVSAMLRDVRAQSVEPFFGPPFYSGPERQRRLDEITDELRRRGVL